MRKEYVSFSELPEFDLWGRMKANRRLIDFDLELTARCNLDCRHCYINVPAGDRKAKAEELSRDEIRGIAGEAVSLGAVWCLLTGGEPLLREDFFEVYLDLKKAGLLLSVFTNATLIGDEHIRFFKKYPPREIEITVYGVTPQVYERVTRKPGSFQAFSRGLDMLRRNEISIRLKAMALRSNAAELPQIAEFCRGRSKGLFRFDPLLHLRYDRNPLRNREIAEERLSPEEIVDLERKDKDRFKSLEDNCDRLIVPELEHKNCSRLFHCAAGVRNFTLGPTGQFRLCASLFHPECVFDLRKGRLSEAWERLVPKVREMESLKPAYAKKCHICPIINLCIWCPAHAFLETGELDTPVDYFCLVAHARASSLEKAVRLDDSATKI